MGNESATMIRFSFSKATITVSIYLENGYSLQHLISNGPCIEYAIFN